MNSHRILSRAGKSRKAVAKNIQTQDANPYMQIAALVALQIGLTLAIAPAILEYAQSMIAQFTHGILVIGQMAQGVQ